MAIRFRVFVDEQGVSPEEERDDKDASSLHALALRNGLPVGTGRLLPLDERVGQIGRVAVDFPYRREGIGWRIMHLLEDEARRLGLTQTMLHAQTYVKAFYARLGYTEEGDTFTEAGIEHVTMRKVL